VHVLNSCLISSCRFFITCTSTFNLPSSRTSIGC